MLAVDTNVLVYAADADSQFHTACRDWLELDQIAHRHFNPESLRILLTSFVPRYLRLPALGAGSCVHHGVP